MARYTAGHVEVRVVPNLTGFQKGIATAVNTTGTRAGRMLAQNMGKASASTADTAMRPTAKAVTGRLAAAAESGTASVTTSLRRMRGTAAATVESALAPAAASLRTRIASGASAGAKAAITAFRSMGGAVSGVVSAAGANVKRMWEATSAGAQTARTAVDDTTGSLREMAKAASGIAATIGLFQVARAAATMAQDIDQSRAALTGLYGSAEKAQQMLSRLRDVARKSPIEYKAFVQGAESLAYMGYEGEKAIGVLKRIETALVASGKGSEAFNQVTDAMLSMVNQGKAYADDINSMSQAGFPAWEMLAAHMHKSIDETRKAVEDGTVSIDDMIAAMEEGGGPTFQKMIAAQEAGGQTLKNTWARVKDNVIVSLGEMLDPLARDFAPVVSRAGDAITNAFKGTPDLFGRIKQALIDSGIVDALRRLMDGIGAFVKGALPAFKGAFAVLGAALAGLLLALGPVGDALKDLGQWMQDHAGVVEGFGAVVGGVVTAFLGFRMLTFVKGTLEGIAAGTRAVNAAMKANPIGLIITAITALVAGLVWAYNNIDWFRNAVDAVWNAVGAVFDWVWNNVLKPVFDAIGAVAQWLWNNVLSPVFQWIADKWREHLTAMKIAWHTVLKPTWDALSAAAQWLWNRVLRPVFGNIGRGWDALLNGMKRVWDSVLRPAFDAIKSAIQSVGEAFSRVSGWIRDTWDKISGYAKTPIQFVVDVVYNNGIRPVWNGIAEVFGLGKLNPVHFAGGGVLPGYAPGKDTIPAMLSPGEAVLTPEATRLIGPGNILALNKAASGRKPGSTGGYGVPHFAGGGIVGTVIGGIGSFISDLFTKGPVEAVKSVFREVLGDSERTPGAGLWTDAAKKLPLKVVDSVIEKAKSFLSGGFGGGHGAFPVANVGAGVRRWAPLVLQALAMLGQPASYLGITLRRMQQESGGNPNAINLWDINAKRGTPSIGLMQVIGPTFSAYRDPRAPNNIYDPLANILASMRYALARYGSLPAAYNRPGGYDSGGWLPPTPNGYGTFYNYTGKPEAVLTNEQWNAIYKAAQNGMNTGSGINVTNQITTRVDASPESIAQAVTRQTKRAFRGAGVGV